MNTTIAEQIKLFEAKRQAAHDGATAIVNKSVEEGRTLDERESEEHKQFAAEIASIDAHLRLLKEHEKLLVSQAGSVPRDASTAEGGNSGSAVELRGAGVIAVKSNLPKGMRFTRFALAMAQAKGNVMLAHEIAKSFYHDTPEVENCLKAAISMGSTKHLSPVNEHPMLQKAAVTAVSGTDTAVTQYMDIQSDFIDLLRPKLIIGRMDKLSRVPFLSRLGRQLTGVTGSFVGEGAPKPIQKQTYDNVTLGYAKVAVIVVLSDEGARFGTIDVQMRARDDMIKGIAQYIDKRFMDPSYSGVANVSPASITYAATRLQASGTTLAAIDTDVRAMMVPFTTSDVDPSSAVWVMSAGVALRLALKRNAYDEPAFPGMQMAIASGKGEWYGLPVLVSNSMVSSGSPGENQIALVTQEEVSLADDGNVAIDMSSEASVQMNDAPSAGAQSLVSLWQNNLLGIRAEQYINWGARRPSNLGIMLLENVNY
jgi:HK97 family phage major capsid protein